MYAREDDPPDGDNGVASVFHRASLSGVSSVARAFFRTIDRGYDAAPGVCGPSGGSRPLPDPSPLSIRWVQGLDPRCHEPGPTAFGGVWPVCEGSTPPETSGGRTARTRGVVYTVCSDEPGNVTLVAEPVEPLYFDPAPARSASNPDPGVKIHRFLDAHGESPGPGPISFDLAGGGACKWLFVYADDDGDDGSDPDGMLRIDHLWRPASGGSSRVVDRIHVRAYDRTGSYPGESFAARCAG